MASPPACLAVEQAQPGRSSFPRADRSHELWEAQDDQRAAAEKLQHSSRDRLLPLIAVPGHQQSADLMRASLPVLPARLSRLASDITYTIGSNLKDFRRCFRMAIETFPWQKGKHRTC